jgi:hypothetical protein
MYIRFYNVNSGKSKSFSRLFQLHILYSPNFKFETAFIYI